MQQTLDTARAVHAVKLPLILDMVRQWAYFVPVQIAGCTYLFQILYSRIFCESFNGVVAFVLPRPVCSLALTSADNYRYSGRLLRNGGAE